MGQSSSHDASKQPQHRHVSSDVHHFQQMPPRSSYRPPVTPGYQKPPYQSGHQPPSLPDHGHHAPPPQSGHQMPLAAQPLHQQPSGNTKRSLLPPTTHTLSPEMMSAIELAMNTTADAIANPTASTKVSHMEHQQIPPWDIGEEESGSPENAEGETTDPWLKVQMEWAMKESLEQEGTEARLTDWQKTVLDEYDPFSPVDPVEEDVQENLMLTGNVDADSSGPLITGLSPPTTEQSSLVDEWVTTTLDQRSDSCSSEDDQHVSKGEAMADTPVKKKNKNRCKKKPASTGGAQGLLRNQSENQPSSLPSEQQPAKTTVGLSFTGAVRNIMKAMFLSGGKSSLSLLKTRANQSKEFRDYIKEDWGSLLDFLKKHPGLYAVTRDEGDTDDTVVLKTEMKLCTSYLMPGGCGRRNECQNLHMCRDFVLSTCTNEGGCHYIHNVHDPCNQNLLHSHYCDSLDIDKIRFLLKTSRTRATVPMICKLYNDPKKGCPNIKKGFCRQMHVCFYFVMGNCKFGKSCKISHNLRLQQPMGVLKKYGYDVKAEDMTKIIHELREIYSHHEPQEQVNVIDETQKMKANKNLNPSGKEVQLPQSRKQQRRSQPEEGIHRPACHPGIMGAGPSSMAQPNELNIDVVVSILVKQIFVMGGRARFFDLMVWLRGHVVLWAFIQGKYGSVDAFIKDYGDTFRLTNYETVGVIVTVKTKMKVCLNYHQTHGCKNEECLYLHVCRHFLLGKCFRGAPRKGSSGKRTEKLCPQTHAMFDPRNIQIMEKHHLDRLSLNEVRFVLKVNRCPATVPQICRLYNSPKGHKLREGQECNKLHVCFYFIKGKCRQGKMCTRMHHFSDPVARRILQQYGFSFKQNDEVIRSQIQEAQENFAAEPMTNDDAASDSDESIISSASFDSLSTNASSMSSAATLQSTTQSTHINSVCVPNLSGKCKFGKKCRSLHVRDPYAWQYKEGAGWLSFMEIENCQLEKLFSEPKNNTCPMGQPGQANNLRWVDFATMEYIDREREFSKKVRRLGTKSSLTDGGGQPGLTMWRWYCLAEAGRWTQYGKGAIAQNTSVTSAKLEEDYHNNASGMFTFSAGGHDYAIHYKNMVQSNLKLGTLRPVRRRPVFQTRLAQSSDSSSTKKKKVPTATLR